MTDLPHSAGSAKARASAKVVVPVLIERFAPRSVLDIGCGTGGWLAEFEDNGVADVFGVDARYVTDHLLIDRSRFTEADVGDPFDLERTFELVVSVEVAEHLAEASAAPYVANIARHGSLVFFSAASVGQFAPGHVNLHWPAYWAGLFAEHELLPCDPFRLQMWNDERIAWWYRQNMLVFGTLAALEANGLQPETPLALAHPALVAELVDRGNALEAAPVGDARPSSSFRARARRTLARLRSAVRRRLAARRSRASSGGR